MNYTKLFYWLVVADNARTFFIVLIIIFSLISAISTVSYFINSELDDDKAEQSRKWMWWSYSFAILFWSLFIFTPSKKDALLIVAGGQTLNFLTSDTTARKVPHEVLNFVVVELKSMAKDAKINLGISDQKDKILQQAKTMTATELMSKMKADTAFAKIILEK